MKTFACLLGAGLIVSPAFSASALQAPKGNFVATTELTDILITGRVKPRTPPPGEPIVRYYPEKAKAERVEGWALVRCDTRTAAKKFSNCALVYESPSGFEFGQMAVNLSQTVLNASPEVVLDEPPLFHFVFKLDGPAAKSNPRFVNRPDWDDTPDIASMDTALKRYAPGLKTEARTVIQCDISANGELSACVSVYEFPQASGVGDAAVWLAQKFHMKSKDASGHLVGGAKTLIDFRFNP